MSRIKITGLRIQTKLKANKNGKTILAFFDVDLGDLLLNGCALVRTDRGSITWWTPRLNDVADPVRSVDIRNASLRHHVGVLASNAFLTLGGDAALLPEWAARIRDPNEPRDLHPYRGCDEAGMPTHPMHPNYTPPENDDEMAGVRKFLGEANG